MHSRNITRDYILNILSAYVQGKVVGRHWTRERPRVAAVEVSLFRSLHVAYCLQLRRLGSVNNTGKSKKERQGGKESGSDGGESEN